MTTVPLVRHLVKEKGNHLNNNFPGSSRCSLHGPVRSTAAAVRGSMEAPPLLSPFSSLSSLNSQIYIVRNFTEISLSGHVLKENRPEATVGYDTFMGFNGFYKKGSTEPCLGPSVMIVRHRYCTPCSPDAVCAKILNP